eukprot:10700151-Alexandrium_andersonii.AAC.1
MGQRLQGSGVPWDNNGPEEKPLRLRVATRDLVAFRNQLQCNKTVEVLTKSIKKAMQSDSGKMRNK